MDEVLFSFCLAQPLVSSGSDLVWFGDWGGQCVAGETVGYNCQG